MPVLALTTPQKLGAVFTAALVVGWAVFIIAHVTRSGVKPGAEVEIAPNRKPYLEDDQLEGPKLEKAQLWALGCLIVIGIGLPLYWLNEPTREAGAAVGFNNASAERGRILFQPADSPEPTHNVGHFGCATCHGSKGQGGSTNYTIVSPLGAPSQVKWQVPALNTVLLRYTRDTVKTILTYGRKNTPMPAWGVAGGGPMNDQQISDLVNYLASIQLSPADAQAQAAKYGNDGAAIFDAYCARCHTKGWSFGQSELQGGGAYGPNLTNGSELRQFPSPQDQIDFITKGAEFGQPYGTRGIGQMCPAQQVGDTACTAGPGGGMPYFSQMLTAEQIRAVVDYERGL
jgi:mono/diheme cytochrome c family protein